MSLELKFRLWNTAESKMISAEEAQNSKELPAIGLHGLPIAVDADSFRDDRITGWNVDHYLIPTQYIGRKDDNEREVYVGDVVERLENTAHGLVRRVDIIEDIRYLPDFSCSKEIRVIGNIYETPELLESKS